MNDKGTSTEAFKDRKDLLEKLIKKEVLEEEVNEKINEVLKFLERGYQLKSIEKALNIKEKELKLLFEFARSRINVKQKYTKYDQLYMDQYSASYSTPESVGLYRAKKLSGKKILDIGCGSGMASIFLSQFSEATGIDLNEERILMAKLNGRKYGGKANFLVGNGLKLKLEPGEFDIIYSDPLRASGSKERSLLELQPNPMKIIEKFEGVVKGFVFDLPPFLNAASLSKIPGTLQYLSAGGNLSRLTLYSVEEKTRTFEAFMLDKNLSFQGDVSEVPELGQKISQYIYVPDASLFYSRLHGNYCNSIGLKLIAEEKRKAIYTGNSVEPGFMGEIFEVASIVSSDSLKESLQKEGIGKVILRYDSHNYYEEQAILQKGLKGNGAGYIFKHGGMMIIARKIIKTGTINNS